MVVAAHLAVMGVGVGADVVEEVVVEEVEGVVEVEAKMKPRRPNRVDRFEFL